MKLCLIGTGYVGLVSGACFAEMGHQVHCVDVDETKVARLRRGEPTIYEPGLQELMQSNMRQRRLFFTNDLQQGLQAASVCFIAVGTPAGPGGGADISMVLAAAEAIGRLITHDLVVVNKSTVPVGTVEKVRAAIGAGLQRRGVGNLRFDVVSNPEFLKEGAAINDFMRPDRIVIGSDSLWASEQMQQLYEPFVRNHKPILLMDSKSAEMVKYAANAMLALRISFMNEMAALCEQVGGDIANVRQGIGADPRIGMDFLYAGIGYGGSCFPKDVRELVQLGRANGQAMDIVAATERVNERQKQRFVELVADHYGGDLGGKTFAVWGLAFKPQTDDMREAPSLTILAALAERGARFVAFDPQAMPQAKAFLSAVRDIRYVDDMMEALDEVDALLLLTEWHQFRQPDFGEMKRRMRQAVIFDGRNQYSPAQLKKQGFLYRCIGRPTE